MVGYVCIEESFDTPLDYGSRKSAMDERAKSYLSLSLSNTHSLSLSHTHFLSLSIYIYIFYIYSSVVRVRDYMCISVLLV